MVKLQVELTRNCYIGKLFKVPFIQGQVSLYLQIDIKVREPETPIFSRC
jgi:hypothetical protein